MPSPIAVFKYLPRTLRPTKEGWSFILLVLVTGFAALNTGNNLLYLLGASLLSLIIVSGFLSELSLRGVALTAQAPARFSAGTPGAIRIALQNGKRRFPSFSLSVTGLVQPPPLGGRAGRAAKNRGLFQEAYFIKIAPGARGSGLLHVTFPRRGRYRLEGFTLSTAFPFGLFIKTSAQKDSRALWVYPKVHPVSKDLLSRAAMESAEVSDRTGQAPGFNHFRDYHFGDDRRLIHWKLSARHGRWIVKEREREEGGTWALFFNNAAPPERTPAWNRAFEEAIEAVASFASFLLNAGFKVSLQTAGGTVEAGEGAGHLDRLLQTLALLEPVDGPEAAIRADPAGQPAILIRIRDDRFWAGKESLFQSVVDVGSSPHRPVDDSFSADRGTAPCR